jgi:hypothetical protein
MANGVPQTTPGIVDKVLDLVGAGADVRQDVTSLISTVGQLVAGVTSVVGFINIAIKVLQWIGALDTDQTQQQLSQTVQNIWNAVISEAKKDALVEVQDVRSAVETAAHELRRTLNAQSLATDDLERLLGLYNNDILQTMLKMLGSPAYQLTLFVPSEYAQAPWYLGLDPTLYWLVPETVMATPNHTQTPPPLLQFKPGDLRWDYRLCLPVVLELATVMISYLKALDPAFRTTGQFHDDVAQLSGFLATFADNMTLCLQWTRDYTWEDDYSGLSPGAWPVGAVDICSGSSVVDPLWQDGVITYSEPDNHVVEPPPVHVANLADSVARAAAVRERKWQTLYDGSGIPELRNVVEQLTALTKVPDVSETVHFSLNRYANRVLAGEGSQHVPATSVCAGRDFPAAIYQVSRTIVVNADNQTQLYAKYYQIPYEFFLESYTSTANVQDWSSAIQRVPLTPGIGSIAINVQLFDWIVEGLPFTQGPRSHVSELRQLVSMYAGGSTEQLPVRRYPGLDPAVAIFSDAVRYGTSPDEPGIAQNYRYGMVTIDYELELSDGKAVFRLQNHPDQGSFSGLYLVVEETPGSQAEWGGAPIFAGRRVLRTTVDVSMVGLEYHVHPEYFSYRKGCVAKAAALLNRIRQLAQVRRISIPRWDPWKYQNVGGYLETIHQVSPQLLEQAEEMTAVQRNKPGRDGSSD